MILVNGPYDGREIKDSGAVVIRMGVYDGGQVVGAKYGDAIYEPDGDRVFAFWIGNQWHGTLEAIMPA